MKIFGLIFTILIALSSFQNTIAQKQQKLVENLDIQGNRRLRDDDLLKLIKIRPGDFFNEKQVKKDLQALLKTGLFYPQNTRVITEEGVRGGVNVIFEIRELPLINEIKFTGLRFVKQEEILAELGKRIETIEAGKPYNAVKIRKAKELIQKYLAKDGYPEAKIIILEEVPSATIVNLTFEIKELPNQ